MSARVSGILMVRDEEAGIARAIRSLERLDAIDEVVVLDTGSKDRTTGIAAGLGARVFTEPWTGDFSLHRNHALEHCRNDWVLSLDGDEELVDPGNLDDFFADPQDALVALHIDSMAGDGTAESGMGVRVFDRREARWTYPVHEQVVGVERLLLSSARIVTGPDDHLPETTRQRLQVLLEHASREPGDPHYPYYAAKLYRVLDDLESARQWADRYLQLDARESREAEVWVWLVEAALARGDRERAVGLLQQGLERHPAYPDLHHLQLTLVALQWYDSVNQPEPRYLPVPCRSRGWAQKLPELAAELGLPLRFKG